MPRPPADAAPEVVIDTRPPPMDLQPETPPVDMRPVVEVMPEVPATPTPIIMIMPEAPPAVTNLTNAGTLDWVHTGLGSGPTVNRKRGVSPALIAVTFLTSEFHSRYNDRPVAFTWSDGMPTMSQNETRDGSNIGPGAQSGFELNVTGNVNKLRTLTLYVGAWNATAQLRVAWTGPSAPAEVMTDAAFTAGAPGRDRMYRIRFQPTRADHKLRVQWRLQSVSDTYGNVTMQGATLTE
ncbi:MAG TPA: hypothetical protein VGG33_16385 [Polyangia bacterium]